MPRSSIGKIARLPAEIRGQINQRLLNGHPGPDILAWLNELPAVKEILAAQFNAVPISERNLTNWRTAGYQRWLSEQEKVGSVTDLGRHAVALAHAAGPDLARGAAALASAKILEFLGDQPDEKIDPENLLKFADAAATLLQGEQNNVRLSLTRERVAQGEAKLRLQRDKQQRDVAALTLRILDDDRAKEIAATPEDYAARIEALGHYMFGDVWDRRPRGEPEIETTSGLPMPP